MSLECVIIKVLKVTIKIMKKIVSTEKISYQLDGKTTIELSSKGTLVTEAQAKQIARVFPKFVTIKEVKGIKKEIEEEVENIEKEKDKLEE